MQQTCCYNHQRRDRIFCTKTMHHQWYSPIKYPLHSSIRKEKILRGSVLRFAETRPQDSRQRRVYLNRREGYKFIRRTKGQNFPCESHLLEQRHPLPWWYCKCSRCSRCWVHSPIGNLGSSKRKDHYNANPRSQVRRIRRLDNRPQAWSDSTQRAFQRHLQYSLIPRSVSVGSEETAYCLKHRRRSQDQYRPKKDKGHYRNYQI